MDRERKHRSIVFIKPGHLEKWTNILSILEFGLNEFYNINSKDFEKETPIKIIPKRKDIEEHYKKIKHKPYFKPTIEEYLKKGMVLTAYYSNSIDIIEPIKSMVGDTNPKKAEKRTIRGIFCNDSLEKAKIENRFLMNAIHASQNREEAEKEFNIWRKYFNCY